MELQREDQVGNLAAFAQKFQLRVFNLNVILVARAEVLKGNHRHDKLLQADTAVYIVLTAALNLHADGVLRGIALDRSSIQLPFQIDGKKEISSCVRSSQRIPPSKLIHIAGECFSVDLVALTQRFIGIEEPVIRCDENVRSAQFVHDDTQNAGKLLNCRLAGVKDFGLRRGFVSDGVDRVVVDVYYIFSGNQFPPFILLHVQKVIVLNGNAGFRRRVQDRVSLHGGTGGIPVNENVHTVVHRNALSRKKGCHTKLRDGREDRLHRLQLGGTFCVADNALGKLGGNLIAKRIRDDNKCTGVLTACGSDISLIEIPLLLDLRDVAQSSEVFCRRVCPASGQFPQEPVLIQRLNKLRRVLQAVFQNVICILERVAEGIMEVAIVGIHTVEITRIKLPDFLRLDDMESAAVFLIEGLHLSDEEEAVKII